MPNDPKIGEERERVLRFETSAINVAQRTIDLAFSSEAPTGRDGYVEILDHSMDSADLTRLNNGAPFVYDHDTEDYRSHIGSVVPGSARIDSDKVGRATVKISKSPEGERFFQDAQEGIRTKVSFKYRYLANPVATRSDEGVKTFRFPKWMPLEISSVAVPVDDSVGIGRSQKTQDSQILKTTIMSEEIKKEAAPVNLEEVRSTATSAALKSERLRIGEITSISSFYESSKPAIRGLAKEAIEKGWDIQDFRAKVLETQFDAKAIQINPEIGMSDKEIKSYSLVRAIRMAAEGKLEGLEKEASDATAKQLGKTPDGFFLPHDVASRSLQNTYGLSRNTMAELQSRALTVNSASGGGFSVATDVLGSSLIEILRNKPLVAQMGATTLSGLTGNVAIPRQTGAATAYTLSEVATGTSSTQALGQLALAPKRIYAGTAYGKQLLAQSSIDVETFVREDLSKVLVLKKDLMALNGIGAAGEPVGIINTTGVQSVTFSAAATWAKVLSFESKLAQANADMGRIAWMTAPTVREKWKAITKIASSQYSDFLWEANNTVNGYPASSTNQVPSSLVLYGNWSDVIIGDWAGLDIVVDPYTLKANAEIEVVINMWFDVGLRHAVSMVVSSDSGAQ
jgi:HK97 family phage major capsid protein